MNDKNETIRRELKSVNYINRLLRRLTPADPDDVAKNIQGAEVIAAEATGAPGSEEIDGIMLYLQLKTGERLAVSLAALPGTNGPMVNIKTAEINTR